MTPFRLTLSVAVFLLATCVGLKAQENSTNEVELFAGSGSVDLKTSIATYTDAILRYNGAVLTADRAAVNYETKEAVADGRVRIQQDNLLWAGEHVRYNFETRQILSDEFRAGRSPIFTQGQGLHADLTNHVYNATNALITADDVSKPAIVIRAKHIRVIPGKRVEATHATLWLGGVPVFYFPYYVRSLDGRANHFNATPGYRSKYGPFILGTYTWLLNEQLDGELHLDYRQKRGVGAGPDLNFHLGRWGAGKISYYYAHDLDSHTNGLAAPVEDNRQRLVFAHQADPYTNLNVKALVRYQNDIGVVRDFFESEYRKDPQPNTFVEVNKFWQNFSLDVLTQPRINEFFETVERLPDVRLTGFQQRLGSSPFFYQSESTAGYYRRSFAETNNAPPDLNYEAARADTYHQITLPQTFFGWLNVIPRAGGRFTYYSDPTGPGANTASAGANDDVARGIFNTGAEVSFKASRLWPEVQSKALDLDGLRHIVEPSVNYVYVPRPNENPDRLPQFDYQLPSLRLLPIDFPEYNSVDSIDSQNVMRLGLRNKLQTKRAGVVEDLLNWEVQVDWRLKPNSTQDTFGDAYSDLTLRPQTWLTLQSQVRYDVTEDQLGMALHTMTIQPNNVWSWTLGHFYLRTDNSSPTAIGQGNDLLTSSLYYRMNENWGFRANQHYDVRDSRMREQYFTVYRDLRSWTCALTFGVRDSSGTSGSGGSDDYLVAFTFSLKAAPRFGLGSDTVVPASLLGR
jgi:LPS-assembly protein